MIQVEFILALEAYQLSEQQAFNAPLSLQAALPYFTLHQKALELINTPIYGVFNQVVPLNYLLKDGDRIEIYRPLIIDPKTARQIRAQRKLKALRRAAQTQAGAMPHKSQ